MKMHCLEFLVTVFATSIHFVNGQSCTTPNGLAGQCKSIYDCQPLLDMPFQNNRTPEEREFLKKSQCRSPGNTLTVCCPSTAAGASHSDCYDADGNPERCPGLETSKWPSDQDLESCRSTSSAYPPDPVTGCCGVDSRNANTVDQYPWLALIDYVKDSVIKQLCAGALISSRYVLTAAHCVTGAILNISKPRFVRLIEYDKSKNGPDCVTLETGGEDCSGAVITIPIERTVPHPEYDPVGKMNDIALIRLANIAPFTDFVRPICLPSTDLTVNPPLNFDLFVAGWGRQSQLHYSVPFFPLEKCQEAYAATDIKITLWNKQLCAGGQLGKNSCKSRSGGPLMYKNDRIYEAIGVISFGPKTCGLTNTPEVYTKVFDYLEWIWKNIQP